ncbi:MAG: DEAD/DEAH box helicase family protein [Candidatus Nitrosopolaris sp.]
MKQSWIMNGYKGSIIYSTGTGKTEIAYECARRAYEAIVHREQTSVSDNNNPFSILFLVPRIVLVQQNINRLTRYGIPRENRSRIESMLIDSKSRSKERQKILSEWGKEFILMFVLFSVTIAVSPFLLYLPRM